MERHRGKGAQGWGDKKQKVISFEMISRTYCIKGKSECPGCFKAQKDKYSWQRLSVYCSGDKTACVLLPFCIQMQAYRSRPLTFRFSPLCPFSSVHTELSPALLEERAGIYKSKTSTRRNNMEYGCFK